jgi:hypothetical protein
MIDQASAALGFAASFIVLCFVLLGFGMWLWSVFSKFKMILLTRENGLLSISATIKEKQNG